MFNLSSSLNDEAYFTLFCDINRQHFRIWSLDIPHVFVEKQMSLLGIDFGLTSSLAHTFLKEACQAATVTGAWYRDMITQFFVPKLDEIDVNNMWFQTIQFLHETFWGRVPSRFDRVHPLITFCREIWSQRCMLTSPHHSMHLKRKYNASSTKFNHICAEWSFIPYSTFRNFVIFPNLYTGIKTAKNAVYLSLALMHSITHLTLRIPNFKDCKLKFEYSQVMPTTHAMKITTVV